jgi:hypothetical protein
MAESTKTTISMVTKALSAMRICLCREPTAAKTSSGERTFNLAFLGNSATRSAPTVLAGISIGGSLVSASINAFNRTTAAFPGHSRKAHCFLPGIDIEPGKCGNNTEPCSVSIFANRRAEKVVELRPDEWRQHGMGHITTPSFHFGSATRSQPGAVASAL